MSHKKKSQRRRSESLGECLTMQRLPQGMQFVASNGWLQVEFCADCVVRVRAGKLGEAPNEFSYALNPGFVPETVAFEVVDLPFAVLLKALHVQVEIQKSPLRIRFLDKKGVAQQEDDPALGISWMGQEVAVYKRLQPGERFLGLGEKTGPLDKRGRAYVNANTDHFGYGPDSDPLYVSIPFFVGVHNHGVYGFFFNNSFKTTFNFGASSDRFAWFAAEDGPMDYFYLQGRSASGVEDVLTSYAVLTGGPPMPPKWALGFQQCRYSYYPDAEVLRIAQTFREKRIPCDVIYLDIHYMDAFKVFTWHPTSFPNPKELVAKLGDLGIRLVVIMDPGIKVEPGYDSYDTGMAAGHFALLPDGIPYSGQVWPGWSHFPDYTAPHTRAWWGDQMKVYTEAGIEGFWNDMNEPAAWGQHLPGCIEFDMEGEGGSFKEARNIYGMQMARATREGAARLLPGKRPFVLTRAGFAGIQRYAAVWTGDNTANEDHMMAGVRLVNSLGLSGVAFAGYDVGGFVGEPSPALYARWMQLAAFSPFFRAHSMINSRDAEPWSFGEEVEDIARNFISLRYRLMPYLYAAFEAARAGMPVARSLAIEWPHDPKVYQSAFDASYLFGPDILVSPVSATAQFAKTYLPGGDWYDFYDDGLKAAGEHVVELSVERLPLHVRAGAVIAMQAAGAHTASLHQGILHLHVYAGGEPRSFLLFEDDGQLDSPQNPAATCRHAGVHDGRQRRLRLEPQTGSHPSEFESIHIHFHGAGALETVKVNGKEIAVDKQDWRLIEPVSQFDPFLPATRSGPQVRDLPFVALDFDHHIPLEVIY